MVKLSKHAWPAFFRNRQSLPAVLGSGFVVNAINMTKYRLWPWRFGEMPSGRGAVIRAVGNWDALRLGIKRIYCLGSSDGEIYRCFAVEQEDVKGIEYSVDPNALTPMPRDGLMPGEDDAVDKQRANMEKRYEEWEKQQH